MKQPGLRLVLLVVALGLWAYIFYTIYVAVTKKENNTSGSFMGATKKENTSADSSISNEALLLDYPDPFLKHTGGNKNAPEPVATSMKTFLSKPQQSNEQTVQIPDLIFQGSIHSKQNNKHWAIITYLGQTKTLQINDTIASCKLIRIWNDSILLSFGKSRFVKRKF